MGIEIGDLSREPFRQAKIVLVQPGDIAAACLGDGTVARTHRPAILLQRDHPQPRVGP